MIASLYLRHDMLIGGVLVNGSGAMSPVHNESNMRARPTMVGGDGFVQEPILLLSTGSH
jgi:hypothetical protein